MALPSAQTPQPTGVYLDASYYANAAKLTAAADQSYAAEQLALQQYRTMANFDAKSSGATYKLATQQGKAAYELAGQQAQNRFKFDEDWAAYLKPLEIRNTAEGMMGSGLLRSGYHDRTQREDEAVRQHEGQGRLMDFTQRKQARDLDYKQAMANLRLQKTQADEARALGLNQEEARRAMTMKAIASQLGLDLGIESASSLSRYAAAKLDAARYNSQFAPQPAPGSTSTATSAPSPTAVSKAKSILANKSAHTASQIKWAQDIMAAQRAAYG